MQHAQVSIGNGRFASAKNNFFDPRLPARASILVAEELGEFVSGKLKLRHCHLTLNVITGNVKGLKLESSDLFAGAATKKITISHFSREKKK